MYYVYVLISLRDRKLYIGFSADVYKRLKAHNAGKNTSTKKRRPLRLIYFEAHFSQKDALRREKYLKTTKGKVSLKQALRETLRHFE